MSVASTYLQVLMINALSGCFGRSGDSDDDFRLRDALCLLAFGMRNVLPASVIRQSAHMLWIKALVFKLVHNIQCANLQ